jgi:hypothetical protein
VTGVLYLHDLGIAAGGPGLHRDGQVIGDETGEKDILFARRGVAAFVDIRDVSCSAWFDVDTKRSIRECDLRRPGSRAPLDVPNLRPLTSTISHDAAAVCLENDLVNGIPDISRTNPQVRLAGVMIG